MQDWGTGRGPDARLHERRGARAHPRDRARCTSSAARGASSGTRARPRATSSACASFATTATATPLVALVEPAGPACHTGERSCFYRDLDGSADRRPTRRRQRASRARRPRGAGGPRADARSSASASGPPGSYTVELLDDPPRIGDKVREEADEAARAAASESDERLAEEAADLLYHLAVLLVLARHLDLGGAGDAQWPSPAERQRPRRAEPGGARELAREGNAIPMRDVVRRRLRDAGLGLPEAPRRRALLPARVRRAGSPRPLLVPRLPPARGASLGRRRAHRVARRSRRPATPRGDGCAGPLRGRARVPGRATGSPPLDGLPPFAGGAVGLLRVRPRPHGRALGEPNPDPVGLPDMALIVSEAAGRVRPHAPRADRHRVRLHRRRRRTREPLRARRRHDRGRTRAPPRPRAARRRPAATADRRAASSSRT